MLKYIPFGVFLKATWLYANKYKMSPFFIAPNKIFAQTTLAAFRCKILTEERIKSERLTASHFLTIRERHEPACWIIDLLTKKTAG